MIVFYVYTRWTCQISTWTNFFLRNFSMISNGPSLARVGRHGIAMTIDGPLVLPWLSMGPLVMPWPSVNCTGVSVPGAVSQRYEVFQRCSALIQTFKSISVNQCCLSADELCLFLDQCCSELKISVVFQTESALKHLCSALIFIALKIDFSAMNSTDLALIQRWFSLKQLWCLHV